MATKSKVNFSTILKRSTCMNSITESSQILDSEKRYSMLKSNIDSSNGRSMNVQNLLKSYLESMCNSQNATRYYWQPFELVEIFNNINDKILADKVLSEYCSRILPYVEDLNIVKESISSYNLSKDQKEFIEENVNSLLCANKILENHEKISNRFNIDFEVKRFRSNGLKYLVNSCASMIDTYKIKPYQKLNVTLEEVAYVLEKNGIKYDKKDMVKYVLEYFLISTEYLNESTIDKFKRSIEDTQMICKEDMEKIDYIFNPIENPMSITDAINTYLLNSDKNAGTLANLIAEILEKTSKEDIVYNIDKLLFLILDIYKQQSNLVVDLDIAGYQDCVNIIVDHIVTNCTLNNITTLKVYNKEDIVHIIDQFNNVGDVIKTEENINAGLATICGQFNRCCIVPAINQLNNIANLLYSNSNLESINFVNTSQDTIPLNEFKIFKFNNLVKAAFNLDRFLKIKEKKLYNKAKPKVQNFISKAKNILFGEATTTAEVTDKVLTYVGEDCRADVCIKQYFYNESEEAELNNFLQKACEEYNDTLLSQNNDSIKAYYIINPGFAEVRIKEAAKVELTEEEYNEAMKTLDLATESYIEMLAYTSESMKKYENIELSSIEEQILNFNEFTDVSMDHFNAILESLQYLNIDKDTIKVFAEKFIEYNFNNCLTKGIINESYIKLAQNERAINESVSNWSIIEGEVSIDIQMEAYEILQSILEDIRKPKVGPAAVKKKLAKKAMMADDWDLDDEDDEDEDDEEEDKVEKKETPKKESKPQPKKEEPKKSQSNNKEETSKGTGSKIAAIMLALKGLQTKFKDFNTKQKEISRNFDMACRAYIKAMKEADSNSRREQIIKGSLIPSFSRCIKYGILLAGVGIFTGPAIPVIAGIGGLAISKKLNEKEKLLLLDEIETELEVVDKELALADSDNNIKKYRALLQYKKNLQRQYQRIRFNLRVGKDIHYGANTGLKREE